MRTSDLRTKKSAFPGVVTKPVVSKEVTRVSEISERWQELETQAEITRLVGGCR